MKQMLSVALTCVLFFCLPARAQTSCNSLFSSETKSFSNEFDEAEIAYLTHTTSISSLTSILKSGALLTRDTLKSKGIVTGGSMGGMGDVVYMQLIPKKTIGTRNQAGLDLSFYLTGSMNDPKAPPLNAILVFSNRKADEALYVTSAWNFGIYNDFDSARPHESDKLNNVLSRIKLGVGNEILFPDIDLKELKGILVHPSMEHELVGKIREIDPLGTSGWERLVIPVNNFPSL